MKKADFLEELKKHDWFYSYAEGQSYVKGFKNEQRLNDIAATSEELKALKSAYAKFVYQGGEEPTLTADQPAHQCARKISKKAVMVEAWNIAKRASERYGFGPAAFISQALKQSWAKHKAALLPNNVEVKEVKVFYTVCVDEVIDSKTKLINQLAVEEYFTDLEQAKLARNLLASAYRKPFIKEAKPCGM